MLKTKQKMQLARFAQILALGARQLIGLGATARVERQGITWQLDLHEGIDFSIWLLHTYEPATVRSYLRIIQPGHVVLDIGANIGAHTLHLARAVGARGRVVAFEPTDYAFAKLAENLALNPALASRVGCKQFMLGDADAPLATTGPVYSSWPLKEEGELHDLHRGRLMTTNGASRRTLDSAVAEIGLSRVDCIKLDIDGHECAMLRGAREVLRRWHPTIIMELAPYVLEEHGASLGELLQLLAAHGYLLYHARADKMLTMDAPTLHEMIPPGASLNVVASASSPQ